MATPFEAGELNVRAIRRNVGKWLQAGVGGVVALGTNGEAPLLDDDESDAVIAAAAEAIGGAGVLIAGTGRESTRAAIAASIRAGRMGAGAVLVRTPSFFKPRMTHDALVAHYTTVADASPVPVLLYNYPAVTGVNLLPETVATLAAHPNVAGIKETGSDTAQVAALAGATPPGFVVLAGSAPTLYPSLCVGARGAILAVACVVPELCVRLLTAFQAGDHAQALDLQRRLMPLARLVTTTHGVPGLKAAMDLAGFFGGEPRRPLAPAPATAVEQIRAELSKLLSIPV